MGFAKLKTFQKSKLTMEVGGWPLAKSHSGKKLFNLTNIVSPILVLIFWHSNIPWAKSIKKNTNSSRNKSQTHPAEQYKVTSFLSTDCELSTNPSFHARKTFSLGPHVYCVRIHIRYQRLLATSRSPALRMAG